MSVAKISVPTVECTGVHRNFSNATSNYSNAVFLRVRYNGKYIDQKLGHSYAGLMQLLFNN